MDSDTGTVTQLLREWNSGNQNVLERLTPLVYAELRRLAESKNRNGEQANDDAWTGRRDDRSTLVMMTDGTSCFRRPGARSDDGGRPLPGSR
jgi:hypothetical protein